MKLTLLYKTDFNHTNSSKELIGVFSNKKKFIKTVKYLIEEDIKTDSGNMDYSEEKEYIKWCINFFFEKNQTQGLNNFELLAENYDTEVLNKIQ